MQLTCYCLQLNKIVPLRLNYDRAGKRIDLQKDRRLYAGNLKNRRAYYSSRFSLPESHRQPVGFLLQCIAFDFSD